MSVCIKDLNSILLRHFLKDLPDKEAKFRQVCEKSCVRHCNPEHDNIGGRVADENAKPKRVEL